MICRVHECSNCQNSICKPQSIIFNDCENQCVKRLNALFTTKYLTLFTEDNLIFPKQSVFRPGALTLTDFLLLLIGSTGNCHRYIKSF